MDGLDLVDVDDLQPVQHRQVHRLLGQLQKPAQIGLGLRLELHLVEVEARQLDDLHAEPVGSPAALLHIAALAKGGQEPVHRGLVQPNARGNLRNAQALFFPRERLDDGQRAVNGLNGGFFHDVSPPVRGVLPYKTPFQHPEYTTERTALQPFLKRRSVLWNCVVQ